MTQVRNNGKKPALAMAALGFALAGCAPSGDGAMDGASSSSMDAMMMQSSSAMMMDMSSSSLAQAAMDGKYVGGAYAAVGNYTSPAGEEEVDITLTLDADGVITDAEFNGHATHPASVKWQGNFALGFEEQVVGKSIDEVSLGVVNGSSLAPKGFMDALAKVKAEASA